MKEINGMSTDEYARHEVRQAKIHMIKALAATSDTEKKAAAEEAEKHVARAQMLFHFVGIESKLFRPSAKTTYAWSIK